MCIRDRYIDEETGEVAEDFIGQLDSLKIEIRYKIEAIGVVLRELKGDIATVRDERHRLEARELSMKRRTNWLVDYVSNAMRALDIAKHKSPSGWFTVYLQKNPDKVEVDYPDNLPAKYQRIPPVETRLKDLSDDMKTGAVSDLSLIHI